MTNLKKTDIFRTFLILLLFVWHSDKVVAQKPEKLKFKKAPSLPYAIYGMAYTSDSIRIYLLGGGTSYHQNSGAILYFDTRINEWMDLSLSQQIAPYKYGKAEFVKSYQSVFLVGGISAKGNEVNPVSDIRYYDVIKHETKSLGLNPMPSKLPGMTCLDNVLYFFGGSTLYNVSSGKMSFTKEFYSYDLTSGEVTKLPNHPEAKEMDGGIINEALYTFGGYDNNPNEMIHKYDINSREWTMLGQFNEPVSAYALVRYKHYFILVGDYLNMDRLLIYNALNNSVAEYRMNFRISHSAAVIVNDVLHVMGGIDDHSNNHVSHQHWVLPVNSIIP